MNRSPNRDPSLNQPNPIIGSLMVCKWGVASLIKDWTPLIGLPDDYLICKSDYRDSEGCHKINLFTTTHNIEVTVRKLIT